MKNFTRAQRKKAWRKFKVGDVVTWGLGIVSHVIVEKLSHGVMVDVTSRREKEKFYPHHKVTKDGRYLYFVAFDGNVRNGVHNAEGGKWLRASDQPPDVSRPMTDPLTGKAFPWLDADHESLK